MRRTISSFYQQLSDWIASWFKKKEEAEQTLDESEEPEPMDNVEGTNNVIDIVIEEQPEEKKEEVVAQLDITPVEIEPISEVTSDKASARFAYEKRGRSVRHYRFPESSLSCFADEGTFFR